ncbi:hypothetical protein FRB94_002088 [Tulasnella sp. JGI-2019a]|nr:hypothetical protein FRB94_002088 [Tulasnella sp. JGI-2019a]
MRSLPHELILEIIKELGNPEDPLAYTPPPINIDALVHLCNVSLALKEMAEPTLYKGVVITSTNLKAFARTILGHAGSNEACTPDDKADRKPALILHEIEQIISILRVLKQSLERLLLDITYGGPELLVEIPDLYMAIWEMGGLKEYASTFYEQRPTLVTENHCIRLPTWPSSSSVTLRRVALHGSTATAAAELIGLLPDVDIFVFGPPDLMCRIRSMTHFGIAPSSRRDREVIWVLRHTNAGLLLSFDRKVGLALKRAAGVMSSRMKMGVIELPSHGSGPSKIWCRKVFVQLIVDGFVWEAERSWDEHLVLATDRNW